MTKRLLRWMARGLIGSLLFLQIAGAVYACPALDAAVTASALGSEAVDASFVPGAAQPAKAWLGEFDPDNANQCAEHCKVGKQSGHASTIVVPLPWMTPRYTNPPQPDAVMRRFAAAPSVDAQVASAPPHAILHCVRRT